MDLFAAAIPVSFQGQNEQSSLSEEAGFLAAFHAGAHWAIEAAYREHGSRVIVAAQRLVGPVDAETIAHEVFYRLLSNERMRESFRGGNLGAWLSQVAVRSAVDDLRKRRHEASDEQHESRPSADRSPSSSAAIDDELEAKILIDRFRKECLSAESARLFELRFLRQLPQRDVARELGIPRSTLVYQEQKIKEQLQRFLLDSQDEDDEGEEDNDDDDANEDEATP